MRKQIIYKVCIFLIFCVSFIGCKKKETSPTTTPTQSAEVGEEASTLFRFQKYELALNDITNMAWSLSEERFLGIYSSVTTCANITVLNDSIIVAFPNSSNCKCIDWKMRRGKLIFDFSESTNGATSFRMPGFKVKVTAVNYSVDGFQFFLLKKQISNISPLSIAGQTVYTGVNLKWSDSSVVNVRPEWETYLDSLIGVSEIELLNTSDTMCYNGQRKVLKFEKSKVQINGKASGQMYDISVIPHLPKLFAGSINGIARDSRCVSEYHYSPFIAGSIKDTIRKINLDYGTGGCDLDQLYTKY